MNRLALSPLLVLACSCTSMSQMVGLDRPDPAISKAQFERIKSLAGEWTGTSSGEHAAEGVTVRYRITGNGSAVEETLFAGAPEEMVSMYHLDGPRLMMTHYCALGNQPRLIAVSDSKGGGAGPIHFEFHDATNLTSPNDDHMHRMEMTIQDHDHFTSSWTPFEDGKPAEGATFRFTRKNATTMKRAIFHGDEIREIVANRKTKTFKGGISGSF